MGASQKGMSRQAIVPRPCSVATLFPQEKEMLTNKWLPLG
jgi:hypothetical protein